MSYEWRFPTAEEKLIRRAKLDTKGYHSFLFSVLCFAVPLAVPFTPVAEYLTRPYVRKARYWLFQCGPFIKSLPDHGSIGLWMAGLGYMSVLLWIAMRNTAPDAFFLVKAFGIVGAAQLPGVYALGMKNGRWSPARVWGWERCTKWHMWGARAIVWLFLGHWVGYMGFFVSYSRLGRVTKIDIVVGQMALLGMVLMACTGLTKSRIGGYKLFQKIHVLLAPFLLPLLYFHVSHLRPYLFPTLALYILDTVLHRPLTTHLTLTPHPTFTTLTLSLPPTAPPLYRRGHGHLFLRIPDLDQSTKHPFTIASYSPCLNALTLTVRTKGAWTRDVARLASAKEGRRVKCLAWPVPGEDAVIEACAEVESVLLIGAGVGIGWACSVGREFVKRGKNVKVLCVAKSVAEVELGGADGEDEVRGEVEVWVTGEERGKEGWRVGRPDWEEVLAKEVVSGETGEVFVGVCGPGGVVSEVTGVLGRWVGGWGVRIWVEGYSE